MNTVMARLALKVFFLLVMLLPQQSLAEVDGKYRGEYHGKTASAVLETITTTLTGILEIGSEKYLLRAESNNGSFSGQLNNIKSGKALKLLITPKGDTIDVEASSKGADEMRLTLKRAN